MSHRSQERHHKYINPSSQNSPTPSSPSGDPHQTQTQTDCGSNDLSAKRVLRTKSRRPKGPPAKSQSPLGPKSSSIRIMFGGNVDDDMRDKLFEATITFASISCFSSPASSFQIPVIIIFFVIVIDVDQSKCLEDIIITITK